ncbi:hemagglutinin repeat-containing protein [Propionivibrio soli]|uniref:two-partner secretion domain-containing protein n=1 Tax=Propionivibrio soli TaxID=2976531 RepID=UPI0021E7BB03|nr:hemagglutinin repeat-containing protein [Propionivibrio soli]
MNKNLYRIVFNKKRGQLMAVAESAVGDGKTAGTSDGTLGASAQAIWATVRPLSLALFVAFGLAALLADPAGAQTVAYRNAPATQRPTILGAANGVPVVNIQTPSAAGVSHNLYERFDVQQQGLILNNSRTNAATRLGGWIQGNPWLARGTASVILNEVVSSNPSLLAGYIEVAGNRAQVIVANPAGITCSGCGFLNASRATLTTGTPIIGGGALEGYRVEGGTVRVEGTGLDATRADYTDIIARAVEVNAGLWAQNLRVTAGANRIDAANTSVTPIAAGSPTPAYAIDVAQLGGMYANKIVLVGTESGVGVKNAGAIAASAGEVLVTADGRLVNGGTITAQNLQVDTHAQALDNTRGRIASADALSIASGTLTNDAGLIQAGGALYIDTHGQTLVNTQSGTTLGIVGQDSVTLATGGLENSSGFVGAKGNITATSGTINNASGQIASEAAIALSATSLDNQGGQVQALGTLAVNSGSGSVKNSTGLLRSGSTLEVVAGRILNAQTQGVNQGIEGRNVAISATQVDNNTGALRADETLTLIGHGVVDNTLGTMSSGKTLTIADSILANKGQYITNTDGTLIAGQSLTIDSKGLTGDGKVLSRGDLSAKLISDYTHTNEFTANGAASLTTAGTLTNRATLSAGTTLTLTAATVNNEVSGQILAGTETTTGVVPGAVYLNATDTHTLTNRGLINGGNTFIDGSTVNNLGTGRIYGDHVAIAASTLNNTAETIAGETHAPVIAARDRLDIGATTIDNREHAYLFSGKDIGIGGALDAAHQATGQATTLNNASATIEALGNIALSAGTLNNTNEHLTTKSTVTSTEHRNDYQSKSSSNQYNESQVTFSSRNGGVLSLLNTPEGQTSFYYHYDYTRTTSETQIDATDPAKLLSGGTMQIKAGTVLNDASQIIAGDALNASIDSLTNTEVAGTRTISDSGSMYYLWEKVKSGSNNNYTITDNWGTYAPAATVQSLVLRPTVYKQNTTHDGSGTRVGELRTNSVGQAVAGATVATVAVDTTLSSNSLFRAPSRPDRGYLIETDPSFANFRQWLSSDYMLKALSMDPATTQKRLGDGFYEQRLVTEQVAQLTGRRFLTTYANDEAQYRALMAAGVTVAKAWNLVPGIALTEAQMAQLTSDIVWLVEKDVKLADGTVQKALVPQLYVRVQDGDVQPSGALIAAETINLDLTGDLANSGTIAGRSVVSLTAENIRNLGGRLSGQSVYAAARTDLTNLGGTIEAKDALQVSAGRDLTLSSTTRTQTNAQGERTNIDRVAGLYVSGENGTLVASAGRDLALLGAVVANNGATTVGGKGGTALVAGHDLTLGTVTESRRQANARNGSNYLRTTQSQETGTVIQATSDLTLVSGHDLSATAANVTTEKGMLAVQAGNNLQIDAGQATETLDERHKTKSKGFLSSKTKVTNDTLDASTALASTFSGNTTTLSAGQDIRIRGSNVTATEDLAVAAGRDVVLDTAQDTRHETHLVTKKKSGLSASYGGISYGKSSLKQNADGTSVTQVVSTLSGENVDVTSGRDTVLKAANVLADKDLTLLAGRNVDIVAAADTQAIETQRKSSSRSIGLTPDTFGKLTIFGTMAASEDTDGQSAAARTALLSANAGNLTVRAGLDSQYKGTGQGNVVTQGADLLAGQTIALSGNAVDLQAAADTNATHSVAKSKSVTLGASLAGPIGEKINAIGDAVKAAHDSDNDRLQGAFALKAGYDAYKLSQMDTIPGANPTSVAGATKDFGTAGGASASSGFGVQVAIGTSKSKAETTTHDTRVTGTNLQAQTIDIAATESDLAMAAAKLQARNITLAAARDVLLTAAANTSDLASTNKGSNAGFGVTFAFGGQQNGFSIQVSASQSKGKANGTETTWDNTQVTAAETLKVTSGRDSTLRGAQVAGDTVLFDVGRDLLVETLQDSSVYYSKQSSSGFSLSLCIPPICAGTYVTGSVSASSQKIKHDYLSAVGQSGIAAGAGGFDITVKGDTDLVGAAITSTADVGNSTEKNKLTTASLTSRDLDNHQVTKASASSMSVAFNTDGSALGTLGSNAASNLMGNLNGNAALPKNQKESSQTQSVISPAHVTITGSGDTAKDARSQATADELTARDPKTANQRLTNTLTLQQAQVLEDKIAKQKQNQQAAQIVGSVLANAVGDYAQKQGWAEGSPQKLALHGLVGLIEAKIGGGNVAAGVLGAVGQEALAPLISEYLKQNGFDYTKIDITDPNLSEAERQARLEEYNRLRSDYYGLMQLGTTLAGTAIGAVAGGTQGAATGATSAYVGVTNNYLKHDEAIRMAALKEKKLKGQCDTTCQQDIAALEKIDKERNAQLDACQGISSQACNNARQEVRNAAAEYLRKGTLALSSSLGYITLENVYGSEKDETLRYAKGTLDGKANGMASGLAGAAVDMVVDTAKALYGLAVNLGGAAIGDAQARETLQAGAGAAWDYVKNPDNWPYLLGVMTPEQREKLAQAYEKGDGYAVGQIMGKQTLDLVANLPSGGAAGTIKIVKAGDKIEDAASILAKAEKGARALADPVYKTTKEAKVAAEALGFKKINETVHDGQAVFKRGNDFITRDLDGHNGGAWKMADSVKNLGSKETRAGTYDVNLNRIGD